MLPRSPSISSISIICLGLANSIQAQPNNPYHVNGNAYQENCNCYTLTNDEFNQSGSVWNINKIDLNQAFDYKFNVNLGCRDGDGADGLVFVLQPISTSIGTVGGGLGYQGVDPSIGIAIDTWQNNNDADPAYDHLSIHRNGDINHNSSNNLAGPVPANGQNIEDCQWHILHIRWDPVLKKLSAQIDANTPIETQTDLINTVFGGNPMVFWGFTGSTGGSRNRQRFCTSLNPGISSLADGTVTCFPSAVQFSDSSTSFGNIVKWFWDFGDGSRDTVQTPAAHQFPAPGIYQVSLNILGNNGCYSDTFKREVIIGDSPKAQIALPPAPFCGLPLLVFTDSSHHRFGSIVSRYWELSGAPGRYTSAAQFSHQFTATGPYTIKLSVKTAEGCTATTDAIPLTVFDKPRVALQVQDVCLEDPVPFSALSQNPAVPVVSWQWQTGDGNTRQTQNFNYQYAAAGIFPVNVIGWSADGCPSDTATSQVTVYHTLAFAGNDTTVAIGQPFALQATGGISYEWTPARYLSNNLVANPIAQLPVSTTYILKAYTPLGCASYDTLHIRAIAGPAFYVPNAFTPNNDGHNDQFRFVPVGMKVIHYFRIFNRYGQLMYEARNAQPGWDGRFGGRLQPAGSYVWMLAGITDNGQPHTLRGTVQLIR